MNNQSPEEIQNIVCEEILRDGLLKYFPETTMEQKQLIFTAMKIYADRRTDDLNEELRALIESDSMEARKDG